MRLRSPLESLWKPRLLVSDAKLLLPKASGAGALADEFPCLSVVSVFKELPPAAGCPGRVC